MLASEFLWILFLSSNFIEFRLGGTKDEYNISSILISMCFVYTDLNLICVYIYIRFFDIYNLGMRALGTVLSSIWICMDSLSWCDLGIPFYC